MSAVYTVYADGGSRGNPGTAGCGAVVFTSTGEVLAEVSVHLGIRTNNEAEYVGAYLGCQKAISLGAERINLYMDSQLAVRQILGEYRVKAPNLQPIHANLLQMLKTWGKPYTATHVLRERNRHADALANAAMDRADPHEAKQSQHFFAQSSQTSLLSFPS